MNMMSMPNPSHTDYLLEVARLNHKGMKCLMEKDCCAAMAHFKNALVIVRRGTPGYNAASHNPPLCLAVVSVPLPDLVGQDKSSLYMHNGGLCLEYVPNVLASDAVATSHYLAVAATLFNLALACHLSGMHRQHEVHLHKACQLYQLSAALMTAPLTARVRSSGFVAMACINNQAHIHHQWLGNVATALELARQIEGRAATITPDEEGGLFSPQLGEIMLNAYIVLNSTVIASAAA